MSEYWRPGRSVGPDRRTRGRTAPRRWCSTPFGASFLDAPAVGTVPGRAPCLERRWVLGSSPSAEAAAQDVVDRIHHVGRLVGGVRCSVHGVDDAVVIAAYGGHQWSPRFVR